MVDSGIRVKSLVIRNCLNLKHIVICDVQLQEFHFEGRLIVLELNPRLSKVSLCEHDNSFPNFIFKRLGSCLLQLHTLTLNFALSFLFNIAVLLVGGHC